MTKPDFGASYRLHSGHISRIEWGFKENTIGAGEFSRPRLDVMIDRNRWTHDFNITISQRDET